MELHPTSPVLVTGATGFVGSAMVRLLLQEGLPVRALVRPGSPHQANLEGLKVDVIVGDITDQESLAEACRGCQVVFHLAADYRLWVPDPAPMYRANVDASRLIVEAAARAGVERLVYCSTVAILGLLSDRTPSDETTPASLEDMIGHYKRSKFLGEKLARETADQVGLPTVFVHPSAPVGPRDIRPTPTGRMILDGIMGKLPAYIDTGINIVHVDDLAQGMLLACTRGRPGERYILGGENMTLCDIFKELAALAGCRPPTLKLNPTLLTPLAWLSEQTARMTGHEPRLHLEVLRMARKHMFFSSHKAKQELGYRSRPAREALCDAAAWFRENGYCDSHPRQKLSA